MNGFFYDKLNVSQTHLADDLRLVGKRGFYSYDLETGETSNSTFVTKLKHEASYSTSLQISCDGNTVQVEGNPSRYGRVDNLFGFYKIDECFALYNQILAKFDLPPFTKCTKYIYLQGEDGSKLVKSSDGATIAHIDLTRNLAVGRDNEQTFIKALASQSIGRAVKPYLYADQNTVEWFGRNVQQHGSTWRYIKVYSKFINMLQHKKKTLKAADVVDIEYFERLLAYVQEVGIAREEHSFKRPLLKKLDCFAWGLFDESQFESELEHITTLRKRLEVTKMNYETIGDQLLEAGVCKNRQAANCTESVYLCWLHGKDLSVKQSQYYIHKARLLQIGIDISVKLDITRSPVRLKSTEVIEVKILTEPDWYRKPVTHLKLVA